MESSTVVPLPSRVGEDFSPLQLAVLRCDVKGVKSLVEAGADINSAGTWGRKPIFLLADFFGTGVPKKSSDEDRLKILKILLDREVDTFNLRRARVVGGEDIAAFSEGDSLCHLAAKKTDPRLMMALLQHNIVCGRNAVEFGAVDCDGISEVEKVAMSGRPDLLDIMLKASRDHPESCSIRQDALDRSLNSTCQILTKPKTDICEKWRVVKSLIENGANPRRVFEDRDTAYSILERHNCNRGKEVREIIAERGDLVEEIYGEVVMGSHDEVKSYDVRRGGAKEDLVMPASLAAISPSSKFTPKESGPLKVASQEWQIEELWVIIP